MLLVVDFASTGVAGRTWRERRAMRKKGTPHSHELADSAMDLCELILDLLDEFGVVVWDV